MNTSTALLPIRPNTTVAKTLVTVIAVLVVAMLMLQSPANAQTPRAGGSSTSSTAPSSGQTVAGTPQEKASAVVAPAIAYLETTWTAWLVDEYGDYFNNGEPYTVRSRCSGFVVNPDGVIMSAGHCVDPAEIHKDLVVKAAQQAYADGSWTARTVNELVEHGWLNWKLEGETAGQLPDPQVTVQLSPEAGGDELPARVRSFTPLNKGDIAILKVEARDLPALEIATDDPGIGTEILAVGFPATSDGPTDATSGPTFKDGRISSDKTRNDGLLPVLEISAAVSGGMSGGPTVDLEGKVVGVNSFKPRGESQPFNFISPSSLVSEELTDQGVRNELGESDLLWRQALDAHFSGDYPAAVTAFEELIGDLPDHEMAREYLKADEGKPSAVVEEPVETVTVQPAASNGSSLGVLPLMIGGVLVAMVLGMGFLLIVRRPTHSTPPPPPAGMAPQAPMPTGSFS
jgi:S1-C subfamily serine protease